MPSAFYVVLLEDFYLPPLERLKLSRYYFFLSWISLNPYELYIKVVVFFCSAHLDIRALR